MKRLLLILFLVAFSFSSIAQEYTNALARLNITLDKKRDFDMAKLEKIKALERALTIKKSINPKVKYSLYLALYNEYKSFNYDKAFYYTRKIQQAGILDKDPVKIAYGKINHGFLLLSSGMFKETFDSLRTINAKLLPDSIKKEYYFLTARTYYDLADFDNDNYYAPIYETRAKSYIDSAIAFCKPDSYEYLYYNGLKYIRIGKSNKAIFYLNTLLHHKNISNHQLAVTASTLSDIYIRNNKTEEAIKLLIQAAIADIKSSTKEAAAMVNLARLLHTKGDVNNAYTIINYAMDDASYYGARQRKLQVGAILHVIATDKINSVEKQKSMLFLYALFLTVLATVIVAFTFIIYRQLKKLKKADKIITETNLSLQQTIQKLNEAEKIKEEYIGYYFNLMSVYINKLDKFKRSVENKLISKKFNDIKKLVDNIHLKKEREELFVNFDKAFLTIFPNFVDEFNLLFAEEHRVKLLPHQLMNTDLRIFALVRLGICDTGKIAGILEYSLTTIYNYKVRIKNKSLIPNDDFEQAVMSIKAI